MITSFEIESCNAKKDWHFKKFRYKSCKHDYKVMHETAKKNGIKNPTLEIPMEVDF